MTKTEYDTTNPIAIAILPLKVDAIARAVTVAKDHADRVLAALAALDWNVDAYAPRPRGTERRDVYKEAMAKHNFAVSITTWTKPSRSMNEPHIVKRSEENEAKYLDRVADLAGIAYEMFVAKLVRKIGPVVTASIEGTHVWGYSFLSVEKTDGTKEVWKTQQITNISKLRTVFNQWPSRKVKS